MAPPLNRRTFLSTVALGTASAGLAALLPARAQAQARVFSRDLPGGAWHYPAVTALLPFGHAVASGDPLQDRVILWTRITIPDARGWDVMQVPDPQGFSSVDVGWVIATDPALTSIVNSGVVSTDASRDFTVKVDADGLSPGTTYWYAFTALGFRSPIGRTRTAPAVGQGITELTIGHVACTSWWQDFFNGYARMGERGDIDLITHAGDHVYEVSGNHMSSRQYPDADGQPQIRGYEDIDNRAWRSMGEVRRRYALYYQCPNLITAHLGAPFAVMADQHDYDDVSVDGELVVSRQMAGEVYHEWTPLRSPIPDGSGRFPTPTGPNTNVPVPRGDDAFFSYRSLDFGDVAEIVLIDIRRHRDPDASQMKLLGDRQWQWLQQTLLAARQRGARHNIIVNQINMSQLGSINTPLYSQYAQAVSSAFGFDPRGPEIYTTGWGGFPEDRRTLYGWLRDNGILDNIVLSGDSHGWFGADLTEDPQLPNYIPLSGASPLQPVGVEMVGTSMGRPGARDVVADELYWAANGGRDNAPFNDAQTYDQQYRPAGLAAALALETAARAANLNLIYFNWRDYGHTMVHLRPDQAIIENWTSPQREMAGPDSAALIAQHSSPVGNPHLRPVLMPEPVVGQRVDAPPVLQVQAVDDDSGSPTSGSGSGALGLSLLGLGGAALAKAMHRRVENDDEDGANSTGETLP